MYNSIYLAGCKLEKSEQNYFNHDLTFYCKHNQLYVPQYKVNVLEHLGYITLEVQESGRN